ncbi:MAG: hypothetical protein ACI8S6_004252 [Myxococcota bacterium]|jgi:hypothetical protein
MRVRTYGSEQHQPRPWPQLLAALDDAPLVDRQARLRRDLTAALAAELARDPELEEVFATSRLLDLVEDTLQAVLPWYGGVLRFSNTALTGWTPQDHFLVQDDDRVTVSVNILVTATTALPSYVRTLEAAFGPVRTNIRAGDSPISAVESVLDAVIETTRCRPGWAQVLFAALQWMHEACGVPLPEARRQAMDDWLSQSCLPGIAPSPMARAEILSAMARSLRRPTRL